MPGLATVREIDGPRLVERVRDDLVEAIQRCDLMPGQALSLRRVAAERRVRPETLTMLLRRTEQDGLLDIRGDVAVVAPLKVDNLVSAFRVSRLMESSVVPKACELISPTDLDDLGLLIPDARFVELDYDEHLITRSTDFLTTLLSPSLTVHDHQVLNRINTTSRRHSNLTARYLAGPRYNSDFSSFIAAHEELVRLLRSGRLRAATALQTRLCERYRNFAEASLDLPRLGDDDQPIAQVIPLASITRRV
ncbi:GntR family transcriptional regulator [Pseudonocardia spinosispora]|uniref:GntR family transcriptional regulator n=1 Tax=Pseudonocardia spinosispora TaxID=103441 RepID=UPI00040AC280|nr:GntR family transcriptional regulator [Pseudonocardia spinosispora]